MRFRIFPSSRRYGRRGPAARFSPAQIWSQQKEEGQTLLILPPLLFSRSPLRIRLQLYPLRVPLGSLLGPFVYPIGPLGGNHLQLSDGTNYWPVVTRRARHPFPPHSSLFPVLPYWPLPKGFPRPPLHACPRARAHQSSRTLIVLCDANECVLCI